MNGVHPGKTLLGAQVVASAILNPVFFASKTGSTLIAHLHDICYQSATE